MSNVKGLVFSVCRDYLQKRYSKEEILKMRDIIGDAAFDVFLNHTDKMFYPLEYYIKVNQAIVELFGDNDIEIIKKIGRYGADMAVRGIFKMLFSFGSPEFIIKRATLAFDKYFDTASLYVTGANSNTVVLELKGFEEVERDQIKYICKRIEGWIERSLEISSGKEAKTVQKTCMGNGDPTCKFIGKW